jgi:hypothetical protein
MINLRNEMRKSSTIDIHEQLNFLGYGYGYGIPTTDNVPEATEIFGCKTENIPETTEIFGCPTDNILENRFFKTLNFIIFI